MSQIIDEVDQWNLGVTLLIVDFPVWFRTLNKEGYEVYLYSGDTDLLVIAPGFLSENTLAPFLSRACQDYKL